MTRPILLIFALLFALAPPLLAASQRHPVAPGDVGELAPANNGCKLAPPTASPQLVSAECVPVLMHEGVPICEAHDPKKWHALVERDGSGTITCTHTHEHHDDPNAVNAIFGPPGAWWGGSGQEISYPWQTSSALGQENVVKHQGYKWHVRQNIPCTNHNAAQFNGCIRAYRALVHSLGTSADSTARFHSFGVELQVEFNGQTGLVRGGGHMDTGHLELEFSNGVTACHGSLAGDDIPAKCGDSPRRHHSGANHPTYPDKASGLINWYVAHNLFQTGPKLEPFAPDDWANPANQLPQTSNKTNNSAGLLENIGFSGRGALVRRYGRPGAVVHIDTVVRKDGVEDAACDPAVSGPCIPFQFDGVAAQYNLQAGQWGDNVREYDVPSPSTGKSLIRLPN